MTTFWYLPVESDVPPTNYFSRHIYKAQGGLAGIIAKIICNSKYGNTEKIARAIYEAVKGELLLADQVNPSDLKHIDLLIIGSPTHGGFPTEKIHKLVQESQVLNGLEAAAFDTRTKRTIFGYAAPKISRSLKKNGAVLLGPPEGFYVAGTKGPLLEGELARAASWINGLLS